MKFNVIINLFPFTPTTTSLKVKLIDSTYLYLCWFLVGHQMFENIFDRAIDMGNMKNNIIVGVLITKKGGKDVITNWHCIF